MPNIPLTTSGDNFDAMADNTVLVDMICKTATKLKPTITRFHFILLSLLFSGSLLAQSKSQKVVVDSHRRFVYTDSSGVTKSYIEYFGETFPMPDLVTVDGKSLTQMDTKNKTVMYNFWFVSCKPCVAEMPALNKLYKKYQSDSTLFIAITFDSEVRIKEFLQKRPFDFQISSLPQSQIDEIKKVAFYPFTAIVNKEGKLSFALFGRPLGKNPEEIFDLLDRQIEKTLQQ